MQEKLTTESVETHRRLDYWRSALSEIYAPLEVLDCALDGFHSEITSCQVDRINVARLEGIPQTISRQRSLIKSGHCDDYVAVVQLDGVIAHAMNGCETVTRPGSITLYDLSQPYELQATGTLSFIDVSVSRADFERALGPAARSVGTTIDVDQGDAPMLLAFFKSLAEHGHELDAPAASRLSAIGIELLAAGFANRLAAEPARTTTSAAYIHRAKAFVETHLARHDLGAAAIAADLRMSVRRLYAIFAEHDLTIEAYIWERRLERARKQLRDPAFDSQSIATIGYGVGFADPAHFARRFRLRFAMTASEAREQARLERSQAAHPPRPQPHTTS